MTKWIQAEDSLPEIGQWVNVLVDPDTGDYADRFYSKGKYSTCAQLRSIDSEGYADWEQGRMASGHPFKTINLVTHWQPLPEIEID